MNHSLRRLFVFLAIVTGLMSTVRAYATAPANDNFSSPFILSGFPVVSQGSNVGATRESGEPLHNTFGNAGGGTVWWRWTAPTTRAVTISTIGSSYDTMLAVYTGSVLSSLVRIAAGDDSGGSLTDLVTILVSAGTVYHIAVDGYNYVEFSDSGSIVLNIEGVASAPAIVAAPRNSETVQGQPASFSVTASGSGTLSYVWQRLPFNGDAWLNLSSAPGYTGATTAALSVISTTLAMSGDQFRCVVSNSAGGITSSAAFLLVEPANIVAFVTTQPANQSVPAGASAGFSVVGGGTSPLSYAWQRLAAGGTTWVNLSNAAPYGGVNTASLSISTTTATMSGDRFRCLVSNPLGSTPSQSALLTVSPPNVAPTITLQPSAASANAGASASFSVAVSGNPAPAIQWERSTDNGSSWQAVSGGIGVTLLVPNLQLSQTGHRYRATASNTVGAVTSSSATLTVIEVILPTDLTSQPLGGTFRLGESVSLSVTATGSGPFQYAWFKDGLAISGATGSTLTLANLSAANTGGYHVVVMGRGGSAGSRSASVTVLVPPLFSVQPVNVSVQEGLNAAFRAVASGEPAPEVKWFSRTGTGPWTALTEGAQFRGISGNLLSISAVTAVQNGLQFQARAVNAVGSTDSSPATLSVVPASKTLRIINQPQSLLVRAGQAARFTVDVEGSGLIKFQWSQNGVTRVPAITRVCNLPITTAESAGGFSVVMTDESGASITSNVAYLTVAGAVDSQFDPRGGPNGEVTEILNLSGGGYLVAGSFGRFSGIRRVGLVRLLQNGRVDNSFDVGAGPNGPIRGLLELAEGKALLVGQFDRFDGEVVPGVVRLDSKGRIDPTFNADLPLPFIGRESEIPALERFQFAVIALRGGGYLLGGKLGLVALTPTGATVAQSVFRTTGGVFALLQQYDGGILAAGDFSLMSGFLRSRMARLTSDFRMDLTFDVGTGPNARVESLLRSPDGAIYVMGDFTSFNGQARPAGMARIGPRGQLDLAFNPPLAPLTAANDQSSISSSDARPSAGRLDAIRAGQVQPNGGIVVTNGVGAAQSVVAVNPSGAVSSEENVTVAGAANALTITDNESIAIGGDFSTLAGSARNNVGVVTDASAASRLTNLSCRARVSPTTGVLILGFVIEGPDSMRVLVRGVGPSLRIFGINDAMDLPQLTLFNGAGQVIQENLGWLSGPAATGLAEAMQQVGAFPLSSPNDTALLVNLSPGSYTAHIGGRSGSQGVALGEIYAVDVGRSRLINSSVRGPVGTGENLLIPGFTVTGGSRLMLVRAVGPGLVQFGVPGTLAQPRMELKRSNGTSVTTNQGWTTGFDPAALQARSASVGSFPLGATSADSAVLTALDAGGYTVIVSGVNGGTGAALMEIYDANGIERLPLTQ